MSNIPEVVQGGLDWLAGFLEELKNVQDAAKQILDNHEERLKALEARDKDNGGA